MVDFNGSGGLAGFDPFANFNAAQQSTNQTNNWLNNFNSQIAAPMTVPGPTNNTNQWLNQLNATTTNPGPDPFASSGGFGRMTDYYSNLGAAYGRATGGFGKMPDGSNADPGRVGTVGNPGSSNPGYLDGGRGLFNPAGYLQQNPDVAKSGMDPTAHWFEFGQKENRNTQTFNPEKYLSQNQDVFESGADPWQHWNQFGKQEGRGGAWDVFNPEAYKQLNPDVAASGADPTAHWFEFGQKEGRQGSGFDDMNYYLANPDVAASGMSAADHWAQFGKEEGRPGAFDNYDMSSRNRGGKTWEMLAPSPGAEGVDERLAAQRKPYADKVAADPALRLKLADILYRELKGDSTGRTGIGEAMLNRMYSRQLDPLDPKYYPQRKAGYNAQAAAELRANPELLNQVYQDLDRALGGSNVSGHATDWASGNYARDYSRPYQTPTWTSQANEEFFRKDISNDNTGRAAAQQIQDWFNGVTKPVPMPQPRPTENYLGY